VSESNGDVRILTESSQIPFLHMHSENIAKNRPNCISCSPTKAEIGFAEIEYLGYQLSANAVRISEKRIEAVHKIQAPKNVKALQRFYMANPKP